MSSDPGYWNIKGFNKRGKGSFLEYYSSIHGTPIKKIKYKEHKPKGAALALSNKIKNEK